MGFPMQEYWSGLPFPPPRNLLNPGIEPMSPALAGRFFTTETGGKVPWRRNGIGYTLPYSWAFLVVLAVKNSFTIQETWPQSLGSEDPLEKGMATHSSILAWEILMDRGDWLATVHGVAKGQTRRSDSTHTHVHTHTQ